VIDVLGTDHPLTLACAALDVTVKQLLVTCAVLLASVAAAIDRSTVAPYVAVSAGIVLVPYAIVALLRAQARRDRALDLILEGREDLAVSVVQRERRRLASPRLRRSLASTIESMVDEALSPRAWASRTARPALCRPVIEQAQRDLRRVIMLLRSGERTVRGVAFAERLLTRGESPLYGRDLQAFHDALIRARVLLELG
jgi:hypothetical protein